MTETHRPPAINSLRAVDAILDEAAGTVTLVLKFRDPFDAVRTAAALNVQVTRPGNVQLNIGQPCQWTVKERPDA